MQQEKAQELRAPEDAAATIERLNTELTCFSEAHEALKDENLRLQSALNAALTQKPEGHPAVEGLLRSLHEASEAKSTSHHGPLFEEAAKSIEGVFGVLRPDAENARVTIPPALTR